MKKKFTLKPLTNPLSRDDITLEKKKRFILRSASGGQGYGTRKAPKVTLAPLSFLESEEEKK